MFPETKPSHGLSFFSAWRLSVTTSTHGAASWHTKRTPATAGSRMFNWLLNEQLDDLSPHGVHKLTRTARSAIMKCFKQSCWAAVAVL